MLATKVALSLLHLGALTFFALKYLRFAKEDAGEQPKFDRFVYFLLDAWRWNFLFSEHTEMSFLKQ
jgi:hypothetical protein